MASSEATKRLFETALKQALVIGKDDIQKGVAKLKETPAGRAALNVLRQRKQIESPLDAVGLFTDSFVDEVEKEADHGRK